MVGSLEESKITEVSSKETYKHNFYTFFSKRWLINKVKQYFINVEIFYCTNYVDMGTMITRHRYLTPSYQLLKQYNSQALWSYSQMTSWNVEQNLNGQSPMLLVGISASFVNQFSFIGAVVLSLFNNKQTVSQTPSYLSNNRHH